MKKILITGASSYIGEAVKEFLDRWPKEYEVHIIATINNEWKKKSFKDYDILYHVAAIAHKKETHKNRQLYYAINRDMAVEIAKKAKAEGVKQFLFMSSMSIFGMDIGVITKDTVARPKNSYGNSKHQAEIAINSLSNDSFKVCILRPPMVYGKGCKGNFQTVICFVKKFSTFPNVNNQRSLIYIENFSNFVKKAIDNELVGTYYPQNKEYMNTSQMAMWIAEKLNKKEHISSTLGIGVRVLLPFLSVFRKGFDLCG